MMEVLSLMDVAESGSTQMQKSNEILANQNPTASSMMQSAATQLLLRFMNPMQWRIKQERLRLWRPRSNTQG
jgi:hypothetical protein